MSSRLALDRVLAIAAGMLAVAFVAAYVAAKVHFFTRFDARNLRGYWAEHWPYSALLLIIGAAVWAVAAWARSEGLERPPE